MLFLDFESVYFPGLICVFFLVCACVEVFLITMALYWSFPLILITQASSNVWIISVWTVSFFFSYLPLKTPFKLNFWAPKFCGTLVRQNGDITCLSRPGRTRCKRWGVFKRSLHGFNALFLLPSALTRLAIKSHKLNINTKCAWRFLMDKNSAFDSEQLQRVGTDFLLADAAFWSVFCSERAARAKVRCGHSTISVKQHATQPCGRVARLQARRSTTECKTEPQNTPGPAGKFD